LLPAFLVVLARPVAAKTTQLILDHAASLLFIQVLSSSILPLLTVMTGLIMAGFFVSLGLSIWAIRKPRWFWPMMVGPGYWRPTLSLPMSIILTGTASPAFFYG